MLKLFRTRWSERLQYRLYLIISPVWPSNLYFLWTVIFNVLKGNLLKQYRIVLIYLIQSYMTPV